MTSMFLFRRLAALGGFGLLVIAFPAMGSVTNINITTSMTLTSKLNGNAFIGRDNALKFADSKGVPYNPVITFGVNGANRGSISNQANLFNSSSLTLTTGYAIGRERQCAGHFHIYHDRRHSGNRPTMSSAMFPGWETLKSESAAAA